MTTDVQRNQHAVEAVVGYAASEGIATITLNRPHRLNAVVPELVESLCQALDRARADGVAAAVLTGAGRAFCSGHDLKQRAAEITEDEDRRRLHRMQDVTRKIRQCPFPVIAAVHGYALGAGCEFALCCDFVVADPGAVFGFPEVGVGLGVTGGISHLLPRTVGPIRAKQLVLLGERFGADEAYRLDLITEVTQAGRHLERALELAAALRERPRRALALAKFALDLGLQSGIDTSYEVEISNALALHNTADATAAALAFQTRADSGTAGS